MLFSKILLPTLKDAPQEAEVISHKLMLRAGMVRKVASGIYTWLPLGLKVLRKIENIVREEMDASGAQEVLGESGRRIGYSPARRLQPRHHGAGCHGV